MGFKKGVRQRSQTDREDRALLHLQLQHPRNVAHLAGHHYRVLCGTLAAEVHMGEVHFKLELHPFSGGVDELL